MLRRAAPPAYDDVQRAVGAVRRMPEEPYPVPVPSSGAGALRAQLRAVVETGRGAAEAIAAADPATAVEALSALRGEHLSSRAAPVLRLVTQAAGGEIARLFGRTSPGAALSERDAARLAPHVGARATMWESYAA